MFSFYTENYFVKCQGQDALVNLLHMCKKMKMTQSSCSFCLELKTQNCCWRLHMSVTNLHVFFFNLVQVLASHILVCLYPMGETVISIWVANALVVSTNIWLLLCYARSCFLQQEISTFWPDSSKHLLLCPLILEEGPISSVYHLLLLPLPHIISVQHFAKVPSSSLSWKEVFRSHFWTFGLDCHNICS